MTTKNRLYSSSLFETSFSSQRLNISPLPSFDNFQAKCVTEDPDKENALLSEVMALLTPAVTAYLPPEWRELNNLAASKSWYQQRGNEGGFYGIRLIPDSKLVGLVFLSDVSAEHPAMHIGYLLHESYWGLGFGSELIAAIITWARLQPQIHSLIAGVEADNHGSIAILKKNGFKSQSSKAAGGPLFLQRPISSPYQSVDDLIAATAPPK
jgi:[ribosomal protein S5]-alanine N-acetyltransferase